MDKEQDNIKIKVLFLITGLGTGGAEMMLYKLLSNINRQQFDVLVVSLTNINDIEKKIEDLGIRVTLLGMNRGVPNPIYLYKLIKILKKEEPHILQTWMYHANLIGLICGKIANVPRIVWGIHHSNLDKKENKRSTLLTVKICSILSRFTYNIVCCSNVSLRVHKSIGYDASKMIVIPNGFNIESYSPDPDARKEVRKELTVSPETPVVGLIGRWHPLKDHFNFVQAAKLIVEKHPDVQFLLCGKNVTQENKQLYSWIEERNLLKNFHLLGKRNDIPRIMSALDVLALSSSGEAFPNVVGEAMACEVPCVVTDVGDTADIVGDTGRVVPKKNPHALAESISEILSLSVIERKVLGERARKRIKTMFEINKIVNKYEDLYLKLI